MRKILLVISSYLPNVGGLQSVSAALASELRRRGDDVTVLAPRYPRNLQAAEEIDQVPVRRMYFLTPRWRDLRQGHILLFIASLLYFPATLTRLTWRIAWQKPNVVNLHFVGAPALFVLVARMFLRFRLVVSLHGDDVEGLPRGTPFDRWVFRTVLRKADAVTACSHYLLSVAQTIESSIKSKGRVIYNGVDVNELATTTAEDTILAAGRMVPKKGFDTLLRSMVQHLNAHATTHLILIGDGPERGALESLAHQLGLNGAVEFRGALTHRETLKVMATSCALVVPSRQEPFGLVALEAMAMGKPVIATLVGGLPEILEGADAVLVEPDNPAALAEALTSTFERVRQCPDFGARNRELAARFSVQRMVGQYQAVYV
jgi:glycosyltransferase involved in cell wall biosynthesis